MAQKTLSKSERLDRLEQMIKQFHKEDDDDGPGDRVVCYYEGKPYSPGARTCQVKKIMVCQDDGKWKLATGHDDC